MTIKYGKGHEDSWVTFRGTPGAVFEDIASFFGFDCETLTGLVPSDLVIEATQAAQGATHVVRGLDARIVPSQPAPQAGDPWTATQEPTKAQSGSNALLEQINACHTTDELKRLWAENQSAFGDQAVMDAWKARGRSLAGA
ncbi:hypothetical protein ACFVKC_01905 [Streptomyces noursei]|uniref:hypothetical protein n=1 Tax=Streptomyces noursei TaxID=1971 RepID=UPI0036309DE6